VDLSVIIPSFNTRNLLDDCLTSIFNSNINYHFEVIVVDNNSKDQSIEMIKRKFPQVVLLENKENFGFSKANNQGAKIARGKYILFLNSDTRAQKDAITKIMEFGKRNPNCVIGSKLLNPDFSPQKSCGPFFSLPVVFAMLFLKGDKLGITRYSPDKVKEVGWTSGACFLLQRDIFEKAGGFDENIFMYFEEVELQYRIRQIGGKILFFPDAKFIHVGGGSNQEEAQPVMNIYKGLLYLYQKHFVKWKQMIIKIMLVKKAILAILIGNIIRDGKITTTYRKAYEIVSSY